jgi:hypothetical protein
VVWVADRFAVQVLVRVQHVALAPRQETFAATQDLNA